MSGHSHWAKLKHSKGVTDAKKSALFTKLTHLITIAARENGANPLTNFKLRLAIEKAKRANVPGTNIERAIARGIGGLEGNNIEEIIYEAFGPEDIVLIIRALTDNKNRTIASLRHVLNKYGCSLGGKNSVLWMFKRNGIIKIIDYKSKIKDIDEFELKIIDFGVEDVKSENKELVIYTKSSDLQEVKENIEREGIDIDSTAVEWIAKNPIRVNSDIQKKVDQLFEEMDNNPDISDYYTNII